MKLGAFPSTSPVRILLAVGAMAFGLGLSAPASAACAVGYLRNVVQVQADDRGDPFGIQFPDDELPDYKALGFTPVSCDSGTPVFETPGRYRDEVCLAANTGNEAVQEQMRRAFGVEFRRLCASAERLAGPWGGR